MKSILLVNQGYSKNVGDIVLNNVLTRLLEDDYKITNMPFIAKKINISKKDKQVNAISKNKNDDIFILIKKYLAKLSIFSNYFVNKTKDRIDKMVKNDYDYLIIGGGELIKSKHEFYIDLLAWINYFKDTRTKIIIFGVSCDRHFTILESYKLKKALKNVDYINARDVYSRDYLINKFHVKASFCPDVGFLYKGIFDYSKHKKTNDLAISLVAFEDIGKQKLYKTLNDYYLYWEKLILSNCNNYSRIRGFANTNGDKRETNGFIDWFSERNNIEIEKCEDVDIINDYERVISFIANAAAIITGRMHAMILAKQYNTEVIPFIFKDKIKDFANTYVFNNDSLDYDCIKSMIKEELNSALNA